MNVHLLERYSQMARKLRFHILVYVLALAIPGLLILSAAQASSHTRLRDELADMEEEQLALVEKNRELISQISVLSSSERIGRIAENELGMHKARKEEIVRVEITSEAKK